MLVRLYVHNFRSFENFEFKLAEVRSSLLIGKNGVGKSSVAKVLGIFQSIGRGVNRVGDLVSPRDFAQNRTDAPIRFEIDAVLEGRRFTYTLALELPERFKELRVLEERLQVDGKTALSRDQAKVALAKGREAQADAQFSVDWHVIALSLVQTNPNGDPIYIFKKWLAQMVILAPYPKVMLGASADETLHPLSDGSNFGDWLSCLLILYPPSYGVIEEYLREVMPDFQGVFNERLGADAKRLWVNFSSEKSKISLPFEELSDGEKCFFLCAVILAANKAYGPIFCFWDEPDNYLSLSEIGIFARTLRQAFVKDGQILVASHSEEAIRAFSDENTWVMDRKNHLEPTLIRPLVELNLRKALIPALVAGDVVL